MNDHHHLRFSSHFPHEPGLVACFCWVFFLHLIWKRTFEEKWQILQVRCPSCRQATVSKHWRKLTALSTACKISDFLSFLIYCPTPDARRAALFSTSTNTHPVSVMGQTLSYDESQSWEETWPHVNILQFFTACRTSYGYSICLSVCHTPVLCQNNGM